MSVEHLRSAGIANGNWEDIVFALFGVGLETSIHRKEALERVRRSRQSRRDYFIVYRNPT